jgi:hypothetical protein
VGTAAKYADKKGVFGGKYSHHDKAITMDGEKFGKWRDKQAAKRHDQHMAQDPKMAKAGYAQNIVDTDKAQKKAAKKGLGKQNITWQQKNSVKRGELPEETVNEVSRETLSSYITKASNQAGSMKSDLKTKDKRYSGVAKAIKKRDAKPDFLDLDKDGNTSEPMKKAAKDAEK